MPAARSQFPNTNFSPSVAILLAPVLRSLLACALAVLRIRGSLF